MGYLPAGSHHVEIRADLGGGPTVFAGDGEIPAGSMAQLYLFGPARRGRGAFRLVSRVRGAGHDPRQPDQPGPHRSEHRGGGLHGHELEPLRAFVVANRARGDILPATSRWMVRPRTGPTGEYVLSNGAALGYRQVPTPAVPIPPVQPMTHLAGLNSWTPGMTPGGDARLHGGAHLHVAHRRPTGIVLGKVSGGSFFRRPRPTNKGEELDDEFVAPVSRPFRRRRWLGLAACSTQEISADPVLIPDIAPSADHGELMISFAPSEVSFEEQQANAATHTTCFHAFLDGKQLAWSSDVDGSLQPFVVDEGAASASATFPLDRTISRSGRRAAGRPSSPATVRSPPDRRRSCICSARPARSRGVSSRIPPSWRPARRTSS